MATAPASAPSNQLPLNQMLGGVANATTASLPPQPPPSLQQQPPLPMPAVSMTMGAAAAGPPPALAALVASTNHAAAAPGCPAAIGSPPKSGTTPPRSPGAPGAPLAAAGGGASQQASAPTSSQGPFVIKCKGLPISATVEKVVAFLDGTGPIASPNGVRICTNEQGVPSGECFVVFTTEDGMQAALKIGKKVMGPRYVTVERASAAEFLLAFPPPPAPPPPPAAGGGGSVRSPARGGTQSAPPVDISDARPPAAGGKGNGGGGMLPGAASWGAGAPPATAAPASTRTGGGRGGAGAPNGSGGAHSSRGGDDGGGGSGNIVIKMRGLPYSTSEEEIARFFTGLRIASGGVSIGRDAQGRASGEAHVEFLTDQDAQSAMLLNRQRIGSRYIELFRTKQAPRERRAVMGAADSAGGGSVSDSLRLRGMPFNSTEADVQAFFKGYNVASGGIKMGPQVGQGTVRFNHADDARRALVNLNHSYMGNRYIELFYASP